MEGEPGRDHRPHLLRASSTLLLSTSLLLGCGKDEACQVQPDTGAVDASSETNDPCCPARPPGGEECTTVGLICRYPCGMPGLPLSRVDMICKDRGDDIGIVTWNPFKEYPCP